MIYKAAKTFPQPKAILGLEMGNSCAPADLSPPFCCAEMPHWLANASFER